MVQANSHKCRNEGNQKKKKNIPVPSDAPTIDYATLLYTLSAFTAPRNDCVNLQEEKMGKQKVTEIEKDMTLGPLDAMKKKMGW